MKIWNEGKQGHAFRRAGVATLATLSLGSSLVAAEDAVIQESANFTAERFTLATDRGGILNVESATLAAPWSWDMHLWMGAANDPLAVYKDGERVGALVASRFGGELGGSVVVLPYLSVAADLPLIFSQSRDEMQPVISASALADIGGANIGDLRLTPKLRVLNGKTAPVGLAIAAEVTLPTAQATEYRGEDGVTVFPYVALSKAYGKFRWAANLGYMARSPKTVTQLKVDDEIRGRLGLAYRVINSLDIGVSGSMATAADDPFKTFGRNYSELAAGPSFQVSNNWVLFAAAGMGVTQGYGAPDWRALAGVRIGRFEDDGSYDADGDGLLGSADKCPAHAEDRDGFEDSDGCPDDDNDKDGIADAADKCGSEAEDMDGFEDGDGCPDGDNDKDGLADGNDKCPAEAETVNGFQDDDGCPDTADGDGDGVADASDTCPAAAEDKDGVKDDDGCPEDDDADGVADASDRCRDVAGPVENGGCPDTDRDSDKVVDRLDNCPDVAGVEKYQGCKGRQLAMITAGGIQIVDTVYFATNKDVILRKSFKLLDNVAEVIKTHPEITAIVIEGHTDSQGDDTANLTLSQGRADAVKTYLINKGVEAGRLQGKGFGEAKPVADNGTKSGRAANRRVEFKIPGVESQSNAPSN